MMTKLKKAFTLMEVNLAIFVMSIGVLSMVSLYELGFRESDQSQEDMLSASYADAYLNSLAANLSATNLAWSAWRNLDGKTYPNNGWYSYFNDTYLRRPKSLSQMNSLGKQAFQGAMSAVGTPFFTAAKPDEPNGSKFAIAMVVHFEGTRCTIAARGTSRPGMLLAQPVYYTEVNFQGDLTK